jgi:hypothetical protein
MDGNECGLTDCGTRNKPTCFVIDYDDYYDDCNMAAFATA